MKNKKNPQFHYFECQCSSADHTLRFVYDSEYNELYSEILLCQFRNFFQRLWIAIKYIFKFNSMDGHYDCWMLKKEDTIEIIKLLKKIK